jgi:hypothetical protein
MYSYDEYIRLSAVLSYQLSAVEVNWDSVVGIILEEKSLDRGEGGILQQVFAYLAEVYGQRRRLLGAPSVLHPLRSAALLCRAAERPALLDLLVVLLHDNYEDIDPHDFDLAKWAVPGTQFQRLFGGMTEQARWYLMERLQWLTRRRKETYYQYIGRLLDQARGTPEAIRVKLADRLDNTLDMHLDMRDPLQGVDFFAQIFQLLFTRTYPGYTPPVAHPPSGVLNGAERLYQLFKNIVLMSLVRQNQSAPDDRTAQALLRGLAEASMQEAQRIALHIFGYHRPALTSLRALLIETMEYIQAGGIDTVTLPARGHRLDGLFAMRIDGLSRAARQQKLAALYADKPLMIAAAIAFIAIFQNFLNDPAYYVRGISAQGVRPEGTRAGDP